PRPCGRPSPRAPPAAARRPAPRGPRHPGGGPPPHVSVRFAARIPVRPLRLIAEGCGLSRAEAARLVAEGKLVSAVRLGGKLSGDFGFTLKR
ncbi:DUF1062 domain-containing protein, partial [Kitasatospora indigofera]|uniref:DUF1062 domain-containing protein n=1 Tax=Kitasatospora indigofera TaxID=67307 RepID=UPI00364D5C27